MITKSPVIRNFFDGLIVRQKVMIRFWTGIKKNVAKSLDFGNMYERRDFTFALKSAFTWSLQHQKRVQLECNASSSMQISELPYLTAYTTASTPKKWPPKNFLRYYMQNFSI